MAWWPAEIGVPVRRKFFAFFNEYFIFIIKQEV